MAQFNQVHVYLQTHFMLSNITFVCIINVYLQDEGLG